LAAIGGLKNISLNSMFAEPATDPMTAVENEMLARDFDIYMTPNVFEPL
jgi:hypothetical protein